MDVTPEEFDAMVDEALDSIPDRLASQVRNLVVLVEDESPAGQPELLGLYDGIPLVERESNQWLTQPDRIIIFRGPLTQMCETREELVHEVWVTVVHELAHHFGIDDAELHEWGYG